MIVRGVVVLALLVSGLVGPPAAGTPTPSTSLAGVRGAHRESLLEPRSANSAVTATKPRAVVSASYVVLGSGKVRVTVTSNAKKVKLTYRTAKNKKRTTTITIRKGTGAKTLAKGSKSIVAQAKATSKLRASARILVLPAGSAEPSPGVTNPEPTELVARFNADRAANGLSPVVENPAWSAACRAHDEWMELNAAFQHAETPGTPGYSEVGAWAGQRSLLSAGSGWRSGNPWRTAPLHLASAMDPWLRTVGIFESDLYGCMTTVPGTEDPPAGEVGVAWYPGQGVTVPYGMVAVEGPTTPGDWVGLPLPTGTGPYLILYAWGYDPATLGQAVLTGPKGPVEVRTVNESIATAHDWSLSPATAMFIPVQPLVPSSRYTLSVELAGTVQTLTFATAGYAEPYP